MAQTSPRKLDHRQKDYFQADGTTDFQDESSNTSHGQLQHDAQASPQKKAREPAREDGHDDPEHTVIVGEPRHISAIIANESSSRSRKGSQRLGLFKENSKAIEEREREKKKREDRAIEKEKERQEKRRAKERDEQTKETVSKGKQSAAVTPLNTTLVEQHKERILQETGPGSFSVPRTKDEKYSSSSRDVASSEAFPGDSSSSQSSVPDAPLPQVAQAGHSAHIDANHRLRAQSPISGLIESERSDRHAGSSASSYTSTIVGRKSDNEHAIGSDGDDSERTVSDHNDEDDEDAEDEISSAVYFPHTTPSVTRTHSSSTLVRGQDPDAYSAPLRRPESKQQVEKSQNVGYQDRDQDSEFELSIQNGPDESFYHGARKQVPEDDITGGYASAASSAISEFSENSEDYESSTDDIERSAAQDESDIDVTPNAKQNNVKQQPVPSHSNQKYDKASAEAPLGAVELKPYKHQVGGHTALFRFSKKAVCKSLSNRENEFYEAIETRHPELLRFLPR